MGGKLRGVCGKLPGAVQHSWPGHSCAVATCSFFKASSEEEREHAEKFMEYQVRPPAELCWGCAGSASGEALGAERGSLGRQHV